MRDKSWKIEVAKNFLLLGNIVAGSLIFGPFLNKDILWSRVLLGLFATVSLYCSAIILFNKES